MMSPLVTEVARSASSKVIKLQVEANLSQILGQPRTPQKRSQTTPPAQPAPHPAAPPRPIASALAMSIASDGSDILCTLSSVSASQIIGRRLLCSSVMVERGSPEIYAL